MQLNTKSIMIGLCLHSPLFLFHSAQANTVDTVTAEVSANQINDLFSGTVTAENNTLILRRCSTGSPVYMLSFTQAEQDRKIRELIQEKKKFWVNLAASYQNSHNEHLLRVMDITEIHIDSSCHLSDFLSDLTD